MALDALERFLAVVPGHVAALEALIDACGQTFYEHQRYRAQVQLADAHLALGNFERARLLSEQLIEARPDDPSHVQRLGRAMAGLGFADGEREARSRVRRFTAPRGSATSAAPRRRPRLLVEDSVGSGCASRAVGVGHDNIGPKRTVLVTPPNHIGVEPEPAAAAVGGGAVLSESTADGTHGRGSAEPALPEREVFEIDLSGDLDDLLGQADSRAPGPAAPEPPAHAGGLDGFFEELRGERGRDLEGVGAALAYDQASEHFNRGEIDAAAACLRTAARDPLFRFRAASMLARIARDEGRLRRSRRLARAGGRGAGADGRGFAQPALRARRRARSSREDARALAVFIELLAADAGLPRCREPGRQPVAPAGRSRRAEEGPLVSILGRLLFLAYFIEVGLVLLVVPWSPFWERNYFLVPLAGARRGDAQQPRAGRGVRPRDHQPVGRHG